jgi:hypothetical protein
LYSTYLHKMCIRTVISKEQNIFSNKLQDIETMEMREIYEKN